MQLRTDTILRAVIARAAFTGMLVALSSCISLGPAGASAPPGEDAPPTVIGTAEDVDALESEIVSRVNDFRISQDLPPLETHPFLEQLAREHSMLMAAGRRNFGHAEFDERAERIREELQASSVSENVAYNDRPVDAAAARVVDGWIESESHRENLFGTFTRTGIGVALSSSGSWYVTQIYAATP